MAQRILVPDDLDRVAVIGDARRWPAALRRVAVAAVALLVLAALVSAAAALLARGRLNDDAVPRVDVPVAVASPQRALVVLAHPGDELHMAGTLSVLEQAGVSVAVVYLAATDPQESTASGAAAQAASDAGRALGVDDVEFLGLPAGTLSPGTAAAVAPYVETQIRRFSPGAVFAPDDQTGWYAGEQQRAAGLAARAAVENMRASGEQVDALWQVTLPESRVDLVRQAAPASSSADPRPPDVAVPIGSRAGAIAAARAAYGDQVAALDYAFPLSGVIPAEVYFRVLDREYLSLVSGRLDLSAFLG